MIPKFVPRVILLLYFLALFSCPTLAQAANPSSSITVATVANMQIQVNETAHLVISKNPNTLIVEFPKLVLHSNLDWEICAIELQLWTNNSGKISLINKQHFFSSSLKKGHDTEIPGKLTFRFNLPDDFDYSLSELSLNIVKPNKHLCDVGFTLVRGVKLPEGLAPNAHAFSPSSQSQPSTPVSSVVTDSSKKPIDIHGEAKKFIIQTLPTCRLWNSAIKNPLLDGAYLTFGVPNEFLRNQITINLSSADVDLYEKIRGRGWYEYEIRLTCRNPGCIDRDGDKGSMNDMYLNCDPYTDRLLKAINTFMRKLPVENSVF